MLTRIEAIITIGCIVSWMLLAAGLSAAERPNIILIFADDLGYGDLSCQGATGFTTPELDRLAAEGTRFTSCYVSQPVCTASRASLLTGAYAHRVGLAGALNHTSDVGIHDDELLLSELLQRAGYATAIFGKWHLGHRPPFLPTRQGFDEFFGIPYSNDNGPLHPVLRDLPPLPLYEGDRVVATDPDQSRFTAWLTERAVQFLERSADRPFFLYLPHVMPHVPIFAGERYRGRTERGLYGDVVAELDASVGTLRRTLERLNLEQRTWIIFASDNGPFLSYGEHAGSAGPLREGKLTTFEGGVRVPCIMRWPGRIPTDRVCDEPITTMDWLPTIAGLLELPLSTNIIDGRDIWAVIAGVDGAISPHEALYFYSGNELHAVRSGPWKLHLPHDYLTVAAEPGRGGKPSNIERMTPRAITESGIRGIASRHGYRVEQIGLALFHLPQDLGEQRDVAAMHPEVVARLQGLAEGAREELGDALTNHQGTGVRASGRIGLP
jgi:arylsulfatase